MFIIYYHILSSFLDFNCVSHSLAFIPLQAWMLSYDAWQSCLLVADFLWNGVRKIWHAEPSLTHIHTEHINIHHACKINVLGSATEQWPLYTHPTFPGWLVLWPSGLLLSSLLDTHINTRKILNLTDEYSAWVRQTQQRTGRNRRIEMHLQDVSYERGREADK